MKADAVRARGPVVRRGYGGLRFDGSFEQTAPAGPILRILGLQERLPHENEFGDEFASLPHDNRIH